MYDQEVKEIAYKLDPECWVSYSGKPKRYKQAMDYRRSRSLDAALQAYASIPKPQPRICECCGQVIPD